MIENARIRLRALEPEDLEILYQWENNTNVWYLSNTLAPFSKYVLKQYLEESVKSIFETQQLRLVIETTLDKKPVGTIDLFDFDPFHQRAGIGILIADTQDRGKGYASDALEALIRYAFQNLNLKQLYCNILESNTISINLFKKAGFNAVGLKKSWIRTAQGWEDEWLYQLINPDHLG